MTDYAAKVAAGIKKLDADKPGWRDLIDVQTLDLESCSVCVLGQVFGDYHDGRAQLDISSAVAYQMGFNTEGSFRELTEAWKEALGKNNTLVEKGDVYTDKGKCCAVKIVGTDIITLDGEQVTTYTGVLGSIVNGKFTSSGDDADNLMLLRKKSFEQNGSYPYKFEQFTFKEGQFVTNSSGKVYYIRSMTNSVGTAIEVSDQSSAIWVSSIDTDGLREVKTNSGRLLSDIVKA